MSNRKLCLSQDSCENWCYHPMIIILLLAGFTNLVLVSRHFGNSYRQLNEQTERSQALVCLKCKLLSSDSNILRTLSIYIENGIQVCCAHNSKQMSQLLQMVQNSSRTNSNEVPSLLSGGTNIIDRRHTSAYKRLLPSDHSFNHKDMSLQHKIDSNVRLNLNATYHNPLVEHSRNVEVLPTGLHILQTGLYHVYSSVYFKSDRPCREHKMKILHHGIVRSSPNIGQSSGVILQSFYSCCDDCQLGRETSYTAGVFNLREGDFIHVEISAYGLLSFQEESSFVGLVMLSY